jgi:mannose-1-phosphate guanylyltransferase
VTTASAAAPDVYAVILAGGSGTRFWPKSRHLRPKQLCRLGNEPRTMLEVTLARLDGFVPPERRIIVTHADQMPATRQLAGDACRHFLAEPEARNTANALALAALHITKLAKGGKPVMLSLHADHIIKKQDAFRQALVDAIAIARQGHLTLVGIVPTYPETGYGYIERGAELPGLNGHAVASFREKPALAAATDFVRSKRFLWNAGLFVWRVDVLEDELAARLPATISALKGLIAHGAGGFDTVAAAELARVYATLPKISIDHAVLEVSQRVAVVDADIGWQDVGSWDALALAFPTDAAGNVAFGDHVLIDSRGTTIDSDGPFVAALGVQDLVVVVDDGAVLVCPKARAQDVKLVVEWLKERGRKELL